MKLLRSLMYRLLHLANRLIFKINKVEIDPGFRVDGLVVVYNKGTFRAGSGVRINSGKFKNVIGGDTRSSFVVREGAVLTLGNHVSFSNSAVYCADRITIEDYVMIGGSCRIWDTDFHPLDPAVRRDTPNESFATRPVLIRESAFIGGGCTILKGVTIGRNAVIGAGSVVTRNVPDNEIWGGNPAVFIKKLVI